MPTARYVTFKSYAGFLVRGENPVELTPSSNHMTVAATLTAQMEAANWGTVQSYDGAGMSAGPLHNIAVQPRDLAQGSLWELLAALGRESPVLGVRLLLAKLRAAGIYISNDGKARDGSGVLWDGRSLRAVLNSDADGKTPARGEANERAKEWALAFSAAFSDRETWPSQLAYAVRWLCQGRATEELEVYQRFSLAAELRRLSKAHEEIDSPIGLRRSDLPEEIDFAMCVYHSFSANGPSPAAKILKSALRHEQPDKFAKALIRGLGTSDFGRWHDDPDDKSGRYDHTRKAVERSGLWDKKLVAAFMPRNL